MGAAVQILNKYQRFVAKALTNPDGRFAVAGLTPDEYSVRVSLSSFLPASRERVIVKAGLDSVLEIRLATLLSSIEVSYHVPAGAMSEDWKWVLRSAPATRPVTRLLGIDGPHTEEAKSRSRVFSGTHALVSVSGGDGGLIDTEKMGNDFGTAVALSTNVLENNQLQVAGRFGQNLEPGLNAVALCAIYSRTSGGSFAAPPEVTLTVAQVSGISSQYGGSPSGNTDIAGMQLPALRTMSLSLYETADPSDNVHVEYGITGESLEFGQHTSRISPFARMTVDLGPAGELVAAYSDGGRPDELTAHSKYRQAELDGRGSDLTEALDNLSRLPQISERNGRLQLQRTQNYEAGYSKTTRRRTYSISGFKEAVSNGRLNVSGDLDALNARNLFSDGMSATSVYDIGNYSRVGYLASVKQRVSDALDVDLAYGRLGGFAVDPDGINRASDAGGVFVRPRESNIASLNVKTIVPRSGTRISADYGWVDSHMTIPRHVFTTQDVVAAPGLNIVVHQPLPSLFGIPGRLELTADLRNLLATGYTPVNTGDGRGLLIVEAPRAIRGGLKFIF